MPTVFSICPSPWGIHRISVYVIYRVYLKNDMLYIVYCTLHKIFKLVDEARPPLPYQNQSNAWFDQKSHYGGLSIFSVHIISALKAMWMQCFWWKTIMPTLFLMKKHLSYQIGVFIIFLSPNVTNTHQPYDMVMIFSIKVGYIVTLH